MWKTTIACVGWRLAGGVFSSHQLPQFGSAGLCGPL
jgi:hypothetical protein